MGSFLGGTEFGFLGGNGGSGSSTGNLREFSGVCGEAGGPVAGQTSWTPASNLLVGASNVKVIIVQRVPEVSIGPSPDFTFDDVTGTIDRAPATWQTNDSVIGWYTPA